MSQSQFTGRGRISLLMLLFNGMPPFFCSWPTPSLVHVLTGLSSHSPTFSNSILAYFTEDLACNLTGREFVGRCSDAYTDTLLGYANSIRTSDGGTHLDGMKAAITRTLNILGRKSKILKVEIYFSDFPLCSNLPSKTFIQCLQYNATNKIQDNIRSRGFWDLEYKPYPCPSYKDGDCSCLMWGFSCDGFFRRRMRTWQEIMPGKDLPV